jgi:signal transduction histidine kinase
MTTIQAGRLRTVLIALALFAGFAGQALGSMSFPFAHVAQAIALSVGLLALAALVYHFVRRPEVLEEADTDVARAGTAKESPATATPPGTRTVFSSINEGLFVLDRKLVIGGEQSPVLRQILRRENFAGLSFKELLQDIVTGGTLNSAIDFAGMLASGRLRDDSIASSNPLKEVAVYFGAQGESFETRYLKFDFKRESAADGQTRILVAVTDITDPVRLRMELQQSQAAAAVQMDLLMSILHVAPDRLLAFLTDAEAAIERANAVLRQPASEDAEFRAKIQELFTSVHGIRTSAAVLSLPTVEARTHALEDDLESLRGKSELSGFDMLDLPIKLADLLTHFGAIRALIGRITALRSAFDSTASVPPAPDPADTLQIAVPDFARPEAPAAESEIPPPPVESIEAAIAPAAAQPVAVEDSAAPPAASDATQPPPDTRQPVSETKQPAPEMKQPAPETKQPTPDTIAQAVTNLSARVARELGKEVRIETQGLELLPADYHRDVKSILIQLARNSVANGIESPEQRAASGKPAVGVIRINLEPDKAKSVYHLQVEDDGSGFSAERIRAAAVSRGIVTTEEARKLDGRKLVALLFEPGFAALAESKPPAAQGVGMDLVKSIVDRLGGRIGVAGKPGKYSRYRITLPMRDSSAVAA